MENSDEDEISDETGHSELKSIINKIKKIVCFFKKSEAASTYLNDLQKESGKQPKRLIQEIKTRWNSLYEMVERYLELHEFVSRALRKLISEKTCKPPNDISLDEIESLVEIKELLKPLFLVTKELCSEKNVTASKVIPLLKLLKNNIENILPIGAAFDLRRKLLLNLNDRFSKVEEHPILSVATLLDPRYKKIHFHQESNVEAAIGRIAKYLEKINQTSNDEPPPPPPKRSRDSNCLWQIHDDLVDSQNETIIVNEDNI
ncbi:E3 SUMO-protein ligase ZBED1-like isoform X1 [Lucilia sericata]|uniref:E3 SUMO-protein ligase ZBED1-like isoform X1 n=1 Tax=Lucilia sericata TaxID=13632 RepID=UPI0018A8305A|nr:E3 SUMO-protein ligase ZBED1-like isoform X1 [Lucilia sericata]